MANSSLQIRSAGRMWRVCQGERVLAFARTYAFARIRAAELEAGHIAERVALWRAA